MPVTFNDLLQRNGEYAKTATPVPQTADLPTTGIPSILIYACLDFRLEPNEFLQINTGEAFILRNAGGSVSNNLADLFFMDKFLHQQLKEIIVIHHADCGAEHETAEGISTDLKQRFPQYSTEIDKLSLDMHEPNNVEKSVKKDVEVLKNCPFLRMDLARNVRGFIYDLKTNRLVEVK